MNPGKRTYVASEVGQRFFSNLRVLHIGQLRTHPGGLHDIVAGHDPLACPQNLLPWLAGNFAQIN